MNISLKQCAWEIRIIITLPTSRPVIVLSLSSSTINTYNYDYYICKVVDRRRGPEDEPVRRESRRVGGKRPRDHPVLQEEATGEEIRR